MSGDFLFGELRRVRCNVVDPRKAAIFTAQAFDKFRQYRSLTLLIGDVNWATYTLMSDRQQISVHRGGS